MNKFIRIGYAIYNIENIISIHKIERNTKRNNHGLRIQSKNDLEYMYYATKKERDDMFERISYTLINQK